MPNHQILIYEPWCKGCEICVRICPKDVLALDDRGKVSIARQEACIGCRQCELHCPDLAIRVIPDRPGKKEEVPPPPVAAQRPPAMLGEGPPAFLGDKPTVKVMTGNDACALGALAAGCRFFAGYPITPSSEIAENLAGLLPKVGGRFVQMEDEIASMGAVVGASLAGAKAMTATSGPGFSLKQENLGYASMAEVPCVVVNVMRGGPSTGLPTLGTQQDVMQARWGTHGDHPVIVLCPFSVQETFFSTIRAFNLAEKYRVPVVLLLDEVVGHTTEKAVLPPASEVHIETRPRPTDPPETFLPYKHTDTDIPPMAVYGEGYRFHVTGLAHDETGFPTNDSGEIDRLLRRINRKIDRYRDEIVDVQTESLEGAEVVVFSYGSAARSAREAVRMARAEGLPVGLFRPTVIWPFPDKELVEACKDARAVLVPELNLGMMAHEVEWALQDHSKVHKVGRVDGEPLPPSMILAKIKEVLG